MARAVGLSRTTIHAGLAEIGQANRVPATVPPARRVRAAGDGRTKLSSLDASLLDDLDALVEPTARGDRSASISR